jgi:ABC-type uncharacterized transport system auxiliary subunit
MNRRLLLVALALGGCGLSERPYTERRQWPLRPLRPATQPPRRGGKVLTVRGISAGPGMERRGLQSVQPDGSTRSAYYEEWVVPPAEATEDSLRAWLAASARFAAVMTPDSRLPADWVLEGELDALWTEPAAHRAIATLAVSVIDQRGAATRILLQGRFTGTAPLDGTAPADDVRAMTAALAAAFSRIEAALPS